MSNTVEQILKYGGEPDYEHDLELPMDPLSLLLRDEPLDMAGMQVEQTRQNGAAVVEAAIGTNDDNPDTTHRESTMDHSTPTRSRRSRNAVDNSRTGDESRASSSYEENDLVRLYLNQIGQYRLLTPDEEVTLGRQIRLGAEARARLADEPPDYTNEQRIMDRRTDRKGQTAKEQFVMANLRLVVSIAKKYPSKGHSLELLDLIQEGNLGLDHAVDKFDPERGFKFSTYATFWIRQSILRAIRFKGGLIRIKSDSLEADVRLLQTERRNGTTDEAIAEKHGWDPDYMAELEEMYRLATPTSTDFKTEGSDASLIDFVVSSDFEHQYSEVDNDTLLYELITYLREALTERELMIFMRRCGFNDDMKKEPWNEIAKAVNLSGERVRQINKVIIAKLRHPARQSQFARFKELMELAADM